MSEKNTVEAIVNKMTSRPIETIIVIGAIASGLSMVTRSVASVIDAIRSK